MSNNMRPGQGGTGRRRDSDEGFSDAMRSTGYSVGRFFTSFWYELKYRLTLLGEKTFAYADYEKTQRDKERRSRERYQQDKKRQREAQASYKAASSGKQVRPKSQTGSRYDEDYSKVKKRAPLWLRLIGGLASFLLSTLATFLLICVITGSIVVSVASIYVLVDLDRDINFDLNNLKLNQTSTIYALADEDHPDDDGDGYYIVQKLHGVENREWIDDHEIPQYFKDAVVDTEDHRFWTHKGVDWIRTVACFLDIFMHRSDQQAGGSTITQQLIKNITGEKEVSIERKLKEIFRALELEKRYTKEQILSAYLNTVSFGNGCMGIESAAMLYFNKHINELDLAEISTIVGITKNPSKYNPLYYPDQNRKRQMLILSNMLEYGHIDESEYEQACKEELNFNQNAVKKNESPDIYNWYVDQIIYDLIDELQERVGMGEADARATVYNGGLKIYSCMNTKLQNAAEAIFADDKNFAHFNTTVQPQCAIVVMNYEGGVECIVGGRGKKKGNLVFSMASQAKRQPGSSMKPLSSYGPAVDYGILEFSTPVTDEPIKGYNNGKDWPKNSGGVYRGDIPAVKGLEVSANCVAVRIARVLKPANMFDFLTKRVHISTLVESGSKNDINLSAAIGGLTTGVTVLEMTAAYQIFGSGGYYHAPYTYTKVVDYNGRVLIEHSGSDNDRERPIKEETASIMNHMLHAPIQGSSGTGKAAAFGGYSIFGKTGTTSNDYDRYFAGGTPYYVSCCWFGYEVQKTLSIKNTNHALQAWRKVMIKAHDGLSSNKSFPDCANVHSYSYCTVSGGKAGSGCTAAKGYRAKNSKLPYCPIHAGGEMTKSFRRFLEGSNWSNSDWLTTTDSKSTTTEEETTKSTTITQVVKPVEPSSTTTQTTTTTTTTTKKTTTTTTTTTKETTTTTEPQYEPEEPEAPLG